MICTHLRLSGINVCVCVCVIVGFIFTIHPSTFTSSFDIQIIEKLFIFLSFLVTLDFWIIEIRTKGWWGVVFSIFFLNFYLLGHTCSIFIGFFSFKLQKFNIKLGHRQRWLWQLIFHHQIENWAGFKPFGPNVETKKTPLVSRLEHFRKKWARPIMIKSDDQVDIRQH